MLGTEHVHGTKGLNHKDNTNQKRQKKKFFLFIAADLQTGGNFNSYYLTQIPYLPEINPTLARFSPATASTYNP